MEREINITGLALSIIILGIAVSIGSTILINVRDARLTDLDTYTVGNETLTTVTEAGETLSQRWVSSVSICTNATGGETIPTSNYSVSIDSGSGSGTISTTAGSAYNNSDFNCTYTNYNISRADFSLPENASAGLGEYGNWFDILVIVGVAAVILGIIFLTFGGMKDSSSGASVGY